MSCPVCSTPRVPGARFCHNCGASFEPAPPAPSLQAGHRRVVTALFADLVGYTRLVDELDPEEVRARVDAALAVLSDAVVRFGGSLEKFVGDAVMAVFGAPEAHDDDALRACLCALHMREALVRLGEGSDRPLQLRVGIATGEVVAAVRDLGGTRSVALTGECMTTAARLQQLAEPEETLLDEATVRAAEPRIGAEQVGKRLLRGQSKPIPVFLLRGERRGPSGGGGIRLIGRDRERQRIVEVVNRAATTGKGGVVLVRGEPGIGKSRLLLEMEGPARAAGFAWMWIDNAPHLFDSPFRGVLTMLDLLASEAGIKAGVLSREFLFAPGQDPAIAQLITAVVRKVSSDTDTPLLPEEGWADLPAVSTDPGQLAEGFRLATRLWISGMVARRPRVLVVDDLHWLDPSSLGLMSEVVEIAADMPLIVLTGVRPPMLPDWVALPHVDVIELAGLSVGATEELGTLVGGAALEPESAGWLYQRTSGNPLFVSEIMRALRQGRQVSHVGDRLRIDAAAAQKSVPLSLRALVGARIDALPADLRSVVEVAAVLGITFGERTLAELLGRPAVTVDLSALTGAGILVRCEGDDGDAEREPAGCWRFRHQLFHDAAYGRLLGEQKRELHGALADRLEAAATAGAPLDVVELVRHRIAAGDLERAMPLLNRAAAEAEAVGAVAEAAAFREAAESVLAGRPLREAAV